MWHYVYVWNICFICNFLGLSLVLVHLYHLYIIPNTSKCAKRWTRALLAWQPEIQLVRPKKSTHWLYCCTVPIGRTNTHNSIGDTWLLSRFPMITQHFPGDHAKSVVPSAAIGNFSDFRVTQCLTAANNPSPPGTAAEKIPVGVWWISANPSPSWPFLSPEGCIKLYKHV